MCQPRYGTRQGCRPDCVLYFAKPALACLYLWESLELDVTGASWVVALLPECATGVSR